LATVIGESLGDAVDLLFNAVQFLADLDQHDVPGENRCR
jgi:hypothetical protein